MCLVFLMFTIYFYYYILNKEDKRIRKNKEININNGDSKIYDRYTNR